MRYYYRPILSVDAFRPSSALTLGGGWAWFDRVQRLQRDGESVLLPVADVPEAVLSVLTKPRAPILGMDFKKPRIMGILNVTPDSFSDGGEFLDPDIAVQRARELFDQGSDILDVGAESTRPGAVEVPVDSEIARLSPCLNALGPLGPFSVDTRKAQVAAIAMQTGAGMVNDVSGLSFDRDMVEIVAQTGAALCLVHSRGRPSQMHESANYRNVVLDVYDALAVRLAMAEAYGIDRSRIVIDPGIGFAKTPAHNVALLQNIALFHSLGCPVLVGVSRKSFIGLIGQEPSVKARMPGSLAVHFTMLNQGVQVLRVHDVAEMQQAVRLWQAMVTNVPTGDVQNET